MKLEIPARELQEFRKAMTQYRVATGKDSADVLNKAGFNILLNPRYGVIRNTPKAPAAQIQQELTDGDKIAIKISARENRGKGGKDWKRTVGRSARSMVARRKRSSGYIVAGWLQINHLFGGRRKVAAKDQRTDLGDATVATPRRLVATLANKARGASEVGFRVLRVAVSGAAKDMGAYARKKMEQTARRYSGR